MRELTALSLTSVTSSEHFLQSLPRVIKRKLSLFAKISKERAAAMTDKMFEEAMEAAPGKRSDWLISE